MARKISTEAVINWIRLKLQSSIDTPATGYGYLGVKSNKHLYFKDADSLETDLMAGGGGSDSDAVAGPASATNNAVALFNGTSGKIIKNSTAVYDSDGFNIASGLFYKINGVAHIHTIADSDIVFTDNTTNNSSTSKHGYLPKLSGDSTEFLNGDGEWVTPPTSSDSGGGSDTQEILLDTTVGSGGQANFDLSSISGPGYMIKIFLNGKVEGALASDTVLMAFNNDTTNSNYRRGQHRASSVSHAFSGADDRAISIIPGSSSTRGSAAAQCEITILDPFGTTFEKNAESHTVVRFATEQELWNYGLQWENTSAINQITLTSSGGSDFAEGTRCLIILYK